MKLSNSPPTRLFNEVVATITSKKRFKSHLGIPLYRNAYYLIGNHATQAVFGFVFWVVAARLYSTEDVGLASAIISGAGLLATISGLGLSFGLIRFLSGSGAKSIPLINSCLTIASIASVIAALVFLGGLDIWSPALIPVRDYPPFFAFFILLVLASTVTGLLGYVFTARRSANFTLLQNAVISVLKLLGLVLAAVLLSSLLLGWVSIVISFGIAMVIALFITLFWFLPRVERDYQPRFTIQRQATNEIIHYSLGNYFASLFQNAPTFVLPLMVIQSLGAEANAYFYVAWAIGSGLSSIPAAIFTSLFAEGSHEEAQLGANTGRAIKINFLILGTALVLILALSGQLLWLFGKAYSESGTSLLRIIALSAIPVSVTHLYVTIQLVVKSIRRVIITSVVSCCLGLAPSYLLMLRLGLIGAGVGWLSGQTLLALILGVMLWRGRQLRLKPVNES